LAHIAIRPQQGDAAGKLHDCFRANPLFSTQLSAAQWLLWNSGCQTIYTILIGHGFRMNTKLDQHVTVEQVEQPEDKK
jgi:hypothetical protein